MRSLGGLELNLEGKAALDETATPQQPVKAGPARKLDIGPPSAQLKALVCAVCVVAHSGAEPVAGLPLEQRRCSLAGVVELVECREGGGIGDGENVQGKGGGGGGGGFAKGVTRVLGKAKRADCLQSTQIVWRPQGLVLESGERRSLWPKVLVRHGT